MAHNQNTPSSGSQSNQRGGATTAPRPTTAGAQQQSRTPSNPNQGWTASNPHTAGNQPQRGSQPQQSSQGAQQRNTPGNPNRSR